MIEDIETQNIELQLLLQAIYLKYGYDFRNYARASIKRRVQQRLVKDKLDSISALQYRILYDETAFAKLLLDLSINVTEMFRDSSFYSSLRKVVIPKLRTFPFLKIWHAGCSTGEEVYSMAILLKEEGLYEHTQIYATDMNEVVLRQARDGIFTMNQLKQYTANYQKAGGREAFSNYYVAHYDHVVMDKSLKQNILFSDHNLATDGVFGEMNLILCRNVMIYFNRELQNRVLGLFAESLCDGGFLCLGAKESIRFSKFIDFFEEVIKEERIFIKKSTI